MQSFQELFYDFVGGSRKYFIENFIIAGNFGRYFKRFNSGDFNELSMAQ